MEAWMTNDLVREERATAGPVVSIVGRRRRQEWERQNRWKPTSADITRIVYAIWPEQAGGSGARPKWIRGARKRRPPMTYAAKNRSEEHTSELQSLMRISYAVFCLKQKQLYNINKTT